MNLAIGRISYVNVVPYFHHLVQAGFSGRVIEGVPSELNRRLAAGKLDLSPSSSFEYARQWRDYLLLPGHSISSCGPVHSVLLFSKDALEDVANVPIAVTGESATSVNLLKVLLLEFCGAKKVCCEVPSGSVEEVVARGGNALLIGDRALRLSQDTNHDGGVYDLGELWQRFTGFPFVFALWIVRQASYKVKREAIQDFRRQLEASLRLAFADLEGMAAEVAPGGPLGVKQLVEYWRTVSYALTPEHIAGLDRFFFLCHKHGLLAEVPEIRFTD
jgi:chorismate dehydratase